MTRDFTHYSLFDGTKTVADFQPLPAGGLREILADLHRQCATAPNNCVRVGDDDSGAFGCLHPDGEQVSLKIGRRFLLILLSQDAIAGHAIELSAEGNESAKAAIAAMI